MIIDKLNADKLLQVKLPIIIDAFINFYGNSEKMNITKKFTNSLNVAYLTTERYVNFVDELLKEVTFDAEKYFFKKIGLKFDERLEVNFFGTKAKMFEYTNIDNFFKYVNQNNDFAREKVLVALRIITGDNNLDFNNKNLPKIIEKFKSYKDSYENAKKYRNKLIQERGYKSVLDNVDKIERLKQELEIKHNKILLQKIIPYLSQNDQEYYDKHKNDKYFDFEGLDACNIVFSQSGPSINTKMIISYFTSESNNILERNSSDETEKFLIKNKRIEYFQKFGFDYGNDYKKYISSKKCSKVMPSEKLANTIENLRKQEKSLYMQDLLMHMPHLENAIKRKKRKKRIYPDDGFTKTILSGVSIVLVNADKSSHNYELAPLLLFNAGVKRVNDEYLDARLVKLFNRLYELKILKQDENKITYSQGFELKEYNVNKREAKKLIECKLLNEIIDEFTAEDIVRQMHKRGNYIFGNKSIGKSYTNTKLRKILGPFTQTFYKTFKKEIIESRKNGKISLLLNVVGQENFRKFNTLLKEIYAYYDENKIAKVLNAKKEKIVDEETKKFDRLELASNAIIKSMLDYKNKYKGI